MEIKTREKAASEGLVRYYTGVPCRNGHDSERYVSTGLCVECGRIKTNAQRAKYRKMLSDARQAA